jgi:dihydrofolate reductase
MGRKTWDSIPPRFRPLKGRLNVVISRSFGSSAPPTTPSDPDAEPVRAGSLEQAVEFLQGKSETGEVGRVFVIGGGQIYDSALMMGAQRVLLTRVEGEFECDTHFGLRLGEAEGWVKRDKGALDAWTGEEVPGGVQSEGGTKYEFQMWEKVD